MTARFSFTVTVSVEGDNYEPEAMEEAVKEWAVWRLATPDLVSIVCDTYNVANVEVTK